jgi:predicted transcriptional regulator
MDPGLKEELQKLAEAERRSMANYIENVLRLHVESKKQKRGAPKAG